MRFMEPSFSFLIALAALVFVALVFAGWWYRRGLKPFELEVTTKSVGPWTWRYHSSGRGPALVLIHGIGANLYCWRWLIPHLNTRFRVLAIDLPGFGGSSKPKSETYGLDEQCDRIFAFLDALAIDQAFVVGNSMGGNIALWLARSRPERIRGVTVIAPATSPKLIPLNLNRLAWASAPLSLLLSRPALRWAHRRTVSRKERVDLARVEESYRTYVRRPEAVRSFLRATEAIRDPRLPAALKEVKDPVLLLWGARDRLVSKKTIDDLEAALGATSRHVHETGGHHLQEDEPEWVAQHIVEFFSRIQD